MAERRELPKEFAAGMHYFNEFLLQDEAWFKANEGLHVVILDVVMDRDSDPHQLAIRVRERFPKQVLYMPQVVRLDPNHPTSDGPKRPDYWVEGELYYRQVLQKDQSWLEKHHGSSIAIIRRQIVGEDITFTDLSLKVRPVYGNGPIFMTRVHDGPGEERMAPPGI